MRPIHVLLASASMELTVTNLVANLSSIQDEFDLIVHERLLRFPAQRGKKPISTTVLKNLAKKTLGDKFIEDYVVVICERKLEEDDLLFSIEEGLFIISTFGWTRKFSPYSLERYIAYSLAGALLAFCVDTPIHSETRGCVNDYCDDKKDVNLGLAKCDVCSECRALILRSVARGEITLDSLAAIYRVLDYAAARQACFVLMPFAQEFDTIYKKHIKATLTERKWLCARADEIYEPREIMNLIWEQIMRADLIIADLTGKNPNVFYELGYAHALAKNTILITQSMDDVPFDLRHRQLIQYSRGSKGGLQLADSIRRRL